MQSTTKKKHRSLLGDHVRVLRAMPLLRVTWRQVVQVVPETRVVTNPIGGGQHLMFVIHRLLDFGMINKMILRKFRNFLIDDKP